MSNLESQAFDEFKRHKNARARDLISGCGFQSKIFACPFFSLPMLAFSCAHTYYIWGTYMHVGVENQYRRPMDQYQNNIVTLYILNQKCMIVIIEKSKCRDVLIVDMMLSLQILLVWFWHCHPYLIHPSIFTPRTCARGKVIGRVVIVVVVVSTNHHISRHLTV